MSRDREDVERGERALVAHAAGERARSPRGRSGPASARSADITRSVLDQPRDELRASGGSRVRGRSARVRGPRCEWSPPRPLAMSWNSAATYEDLDLFEPRTVATGTGTRGRKRGMEAPQVHGPPSGCARPPCTRGRGRAASGRRCSRTAKVTADARSGSSAERVRGRRLHGLRVEVDIIHRSLQLARSRRASARRARRAERPSCHRLLVDQKVSRDPRPARAMGRSQAASCAAP